MEDILKCDICTNEFNLENRKPLTAKCGHTYCKHCILSNKGENESSCPICQIPYILSIESCIPNIKLEEIIKFIFNIPDKQIIYVKPDVARRKSPDVRYNNFSKDIQKTTYRSSTMNKAQSNFCFTKTTISNQVSKNINSKMTSFQINKQQDKDYNQMRYINNNGNTNSNSNGSRNGNDNNNDNDNIHGNNLKITRFDIDEEKNNNMSETIEAIPINDENNQSFSDEFKELLKKDSRNNNDNNGNNLDILSRMSMDETDKKDEDCNNNNNDNNNNNNDIPCCKAPIPIIEKKKPSNKVEAFEKLLEDLNNIPLLDCSSIKRKKYEEQIKKASEYEKFKNDYENLELKQFNNGDFFIGYLAKNSEKMTNGILYSNNGDYYEGEFMNDKKEGYGVLVYKNGTRYEGELKNNKHNGYGKLTQLDGEVFIGNWKDGKINGNGVRYHSNGDRYIGCYINNIRNGQGHYIFTNGDSYEGNWSNGKANGKGKFTFKNGNVYEGEFVDNAICGRGVFTMSNGDVYTGMFKIGLINGKGSLKTKKGERYLGEFYNGKKHGAGKYFNADGTLLCSGQWNLDKFIGKKQANEVV